MLATSRLHLSTALINPKLDGVAHLTHNRRRRSILPLKNRRFIMSLSLHQQAQPSDLAHFTTSIVGSSPSSIHLSHWTLTHRHTHILNFMACAAAISATWLLCSAIPSLLAFRRSAESMEKLMDVTREELPDTMAAVRLSGMEISDLTMELSDLGQEITKGVKSSTRAVRMAEEKLRRLTNTTPSGGSSNGSQGIRTSSS